MRPDHEIATEIAEHEAALRRLRAERRQPAKDRIDGIVAEHDAGRSNRQIADARGMTIVAVIGVLWRAGRTSGGRTAIRAAVRGASAEVRAQVSAKAAA